MNCFDMDKYSFAPAVMNAISCDHNTKFSDIEALKGISKIMNTKIPQSISSLFDAPILHDTVIEKENLKLE